MTGKERCAYLRNLREKTARENHIPYESTPCTYEGDDCIGTCPKCEEELRYLTNALQEKMRRGETVAPGAEWSLLKAHTDPDWLLVIPAADAGVAAPLDDEPPLSLDELPDILSGVVHSFAPEEFFGPEEEEQKRKGSPDIWDGDLIFCPSCGAIHASPMAFCDNCGAALQGRSGIATQSSSLPPVAEMLDTLRSRVSRLLEQEEQNQIRQMKDGLDRMIRWVEKLEQEAKDERSARERREREWKFGSHEAVGFVEMICDD